MGFLAAIPAAFSTLATASTATAAEIAAATATLAETTTAVSVASAAYAGYSSYKSSQFQSAVAKNNAAISANNANTALEQGQVAGSNSLEATSKRVGAAMAAQGANGVDVGFGSPAQVRAGIKDSGDLDAATIQHNSQAQALAYSQQASGFKTESDYDQLSGNNAIIAGGINAGSSLIGGATSLSKLALARVTGQVGGQ